jgi:hypothetical protein
MKVMDGKDALNQPCDECGTKGEAMVEFDRAKRGDDVTSFFLCCVCILDASRLLATAEEE